jgi:cleavage and polyadenylation specificity factor subunit 3
MARLKQSLQQKYENMNIQVFSPKNGTTVQLQFRGEKLAKVIGKLAARPPDNGTIVSGLLIEKDFEHNIMDPTDLINHTQLTTSTIAQRLIVPCTHSFDTVKELIAQMYDNIDDIMVQDNQALRVSDNNLWN